jgi:hypothetical protein
VEWRELLEGCHTAFVHGQCGSYAAPGNAEAENKDMWLI